MIAKNMTDIVSKSSEIRKMFEEGMALAKKIGKENVYDFSLGNPSVKPPEKIKEAVKDILDNKDPNYVHGYMANAGYPEVRETIAESLNKRFGTDFVSTDIIMTVGAAGGLNVMMKTLLDPGDEVIVFAPFFGEYRNYVSNFKGNIVVIPADTETFHLRLDLLEDAVTEKTKAIIINNPNNPSGVIYKADELKELDGILKKCEERIGHPVYVISDEPYRELAYDGAEVPFITTCIKNAIVGYSYSKSLSLPGERIGYLAIPSQIDDHDNVRDAAIAANRILGYVNAPSLMQLVIRECVDEKCDVDAYDRNRRLLYEGLTDLGFTCIKPEGAFYLLLKSPDPDEHVFIDAAKKYGILTVSTASFGCAGYVRIAYCVSEDTIVRSMPQFAKVAADLGVTKA
ncbi:MAG: pyridoxal phosphate-dependent aminotransferase [Lachnospiraceae bacterium]|nr:pyridoxal phosphate-dependent aminotransferase [Lachnospiraceae bacterium]